MSEWLKLMLGEIDRRREENEEALKESERRAAEAASDEPSDKDRQDK